jgi:hypothetical protein
MGSSSPPKAPDPWDTAASQFGVNYGTGQMNGLMGQVNQNTPYGSLNYDQTGSTQMQNPFTGEMMEIPRFTATTTMTPQSRKIFNTSQGAKQNFADISRNLSGRLENSLSRPVNMNRAPDAQYKTVGAGPDLKGGFAGAGPITKSYGTDFSQDRQNVQDALMARMQPSMDRDRAQLDANLANRGIKLGSGAYSDAQGILGQNVNDARMGAILGAGDEQGRMVGMERDRAMFENASQGQQYGQNLGRAQFSNNANQQEFQNQMARRGFNNSATQQGRGDWLSEQYGQRNQGINELIGLMSGSQVQSPNFSVGGGAQMPTVDYGGLQQQGYQNQLGQWQTQQQNNPWNGIMGGLFGLGQAGIGIM